MWIVFTILIIVVCVVIAIKCSSDPSDDVVMTVTYKEKPMERSPMERSHEFINVINAPSEPIEVLSTPVESKSEPSQNVSEDKPKKAFVTQREREREFKPSEKKTDVEVNSSYESTRVPVFGSYPPKSTSKPVVEDVFHDEWYNNQADYSYLDANEARRRLREAKEDGEWLDEEEYYGLLDVVASEKNDRYFEKIDSMTPEQTEKWFQRNYDRDIKMSTEVWIAVGKKVAPIHEQFLIDGMRNKTSKGIGSYVNARKREGYFFTARAYRLANRIFSGEFDDKKQRKVLKELDIDDI